MRREWILFKSLSPSPDMNDTKHKRRDKEMVIFLKGVLETLDYFIHCMAEGVNDADIMDVTEQTFIQRLLEMDSQIDRTTDVITFNNVGIEVRVKGEENYWEIKKVKLHNILVDAPAWYEKVLKYDFKCMQIITIDRYHKEFINKYFPNYASVQFLPHGGAKLPETEQIAYEDRQIDVLYVGNRAECLGENNQYSFLPDKGRELFETARQLLIKYPHMTLETIYDLYMNEIGIGLIQDAELDVIHTLYGEILWAVRGYYQGKVIEALAASGIHVEIYSSGWEDVAEKYPDYVHTHERISPEECIRLICNSKITLNVQPWFKYGAHERIYNAMLNGSVCVTDTSEYLKKYFQNGKNIVFYELNQLDNLVKNVHLLLENPGFAKSIIENQKKAVVGSAWSNRLHNILEQRFEEGVDFI